MNKPQFYDEAPNLNGDYVVLPVGGHICEIKKAVNEKSQAGNDMLVLLLDVAVGEYKDYYKNRFDKDNRQDKKWGCVLRIVVDDPSKTNDIRTKIAGRLKGAITSIEASNDGYKFDWNPESLKGKLVGVEFALREYTANDGSVKTIVEPRRLRSKEIIESGKAQILAVKLLDNSYMEYDDYMEKLAEAKYENQTADFEKVDVDKDDLPF